MQKELLEEHAELVTFSHIRSFVDKELIQDKQKNVLILEGETLEKVLAQAAVEFGVKTEDIDYEIINKGSLGFWGVGKKVWKILVYFSRSYLVKIAKQSEKEAEYLDKINTVVHGTVSVLRTTEGLMMRVTPPYYDGEPVAVSTAMQKLRARMKAVDFDFEKVSTVVEHASNQWVKIIDFDLQSNSDAVPICEISRDVMSASITLLPPDEGGIDTTVDICKELLKKHGVTRGIKNDILHELCENPVFNKPVKVAFGQPARNGNDGKIIYSFNVDKHVSLHEVDGKINFKDLNQVANVIEGQPLAKLIEPQKGVDGYTVTGDVLLAQEGASVELKIGKNVRLNEDGNIAISEINGEANIANEVINVESVHIIEENVGVKTGNIFFLGTVVVKGSLKDGFEIKAAGTVEIHGTVGKSKVEAEGDIIVHQGIVGKGEGQLISGGNIFTKFIENAKVQATQKVVASDGIINSEVLSGASVLCNSGKRAAIVSGRVIAFEEVRARNIGAVSGTETIIEVGVDPDKKLELESIIKELQKLQMEFESTEKDFTILNTQVNIEGNASQEKVHHFDELKTHREQISVRIGELEERKHEIQQYFSEIRRESRIIGEGIVYQGVHLHIKDTILHVKNEYKGQVFTQDPENERLIEITPFDPKDYEE